jgi:enamine deaminase RidA (YjgF/YER057c/UK114 family)
MSICDPRRADGAMNDLRHVVQPAGMAPGTGYSHVVSGHGRLVFVSGQLALDERGELVGAEDPAAQATQVFANLGRCLAAAGATFADVVKLTFFLTDTAQLPAVRAARDAVFDVQHPPASSAVVVAGLVRPGCLLEIEAYALVDG